MVSSRVFERAVRLALKWSQHHTTAAGNNLFMQVSPLRGA